MELSISTIIKFIIAIIVIVAVSYGLYTVFRNQVFGSFKNIGLDGTIKFILTLI